ncbi:MAG: asparaginase domain-containing protein [Elusimicrobiota bacterium]|nr:asparaginase domain-containing protein [Elusimicrobiota bacterium]
MKIKIIITGGTFDKEYNELSGRLFFKKTHIHEMLKLGRSKVQTVIKSLMMIDSLYMTNKDRLKILDECKKSKEKNIVITHGTDTMQETAKILGGKIKNKTIVITGAMVPYKFGSSDGLFNLGSAISFAQVLPHGVYVAMNGKYFCWTNVRKNRKKGEFETKS